MLNRFKRLGKDTIVYGLGTVLRRFISVLLVPIYTRVFVPADYGVLDVISTVTILMSIVVVMGFETALSFYYYDTDDPADRALTISTSFFYRLFLSVGVCVVMVSQARPLAMMLLKDAAYANLLRVAAMGLPFAVLLSFYTDLFRLTFTPWRFLVVNLGAAMVTILLSIYLVVIAHLGLLGALWATLIGNAIFALVGLFLTRQHYRLVFSWKRLKQLLAYGVPLIPAGISIWIINYSNRYFLLHFTDLNEVGLYSIGMKVSYVVLVATSAFRLAWAPTLYATSKEEDARAFYARILTYYLFLALFLMVGVSVFAKELLIVISQPAYYEGYKVVALLSLGMVLYGALPVVGGGLALTRKTIHTGWIILFAATVNVLALVMLVPKLSIVGAAVANTIAYLISAILFYAISQRYYYVPFELRKIGTILLVMVLIVTTGTVLNTGSLTLNIMLKALIVGLYPVSLYFLGVLSRSEVDGARSIVLKISQVLIVRAQSFRDMLLSSR